MGNTRGEKPCFGNQLVRSFSDDFRQMHTGDALSRGLASKLAIDAERERNLAALKDQWNIFLLEGREMAVCSVPDEEVFLLDQSRQLYRAWTKFCERLPDGQRKEMSEGIPSLSLLRESVTKASTTWNENREGTQTGRVKSIFTRLCENFASHSNLVSILPTNDKYVSLLTGSLSAIAQASINHQEIAQGVAASIEELSQDMAYWNRLISEYTNTQILQRYIMELYLVVFEFLTEIFTQWSRSSWRRFITSFDEQAFQKILSDRRGRIKVIEQKMRRHADLEFQKGVREYMQEDANHQANQSQRQDHMQLDLQAILQNQFTQQQLISKLGADVYRLLHQRMDDPPPPSVDRDPPQLSSSAVPLLVTAGIEMDEPLRSSPMLTTEPEEYGRGDVSEERSLPARHHYDRQEFLDLLSPIVRKFGSDIQSMVGITSRAMNITVNNQVKRRIDTWTTNPQSDKLWVQGPHEVSHPSQNTLTGVCLVALSNNNQIPCLSYFCSLGVHASSDTPNLSCRDMLLDLVKSLIVQLVLMLPEHIATAADLSLARFEKLVAPGADHLGSALLLLRDLRALAPGYVHCVIEAVQELEDRSDARHTRNLLRVLREVVDVARDRNVTKVCFTSDGYVDSLAELVQGGHLQRVEYSEEVDQDNGGEGSGIMPRWDDDME